jgi:hypothetical protein
MGHYNVGSRHPTYVLGEAARPFSRLRTQGLRGFPPEGS